MLRKHHTSRVQRHQREDCTRLQFTDIRCICSFSCCEGKRCQGARIRDSLFEFCCAGKRTCCLPVCSRDTANEFCCADTGLTRHAWHSFAFSCIQSANACSSPDTCKIRSMWCRVRDIQCTTYDPYSHDGSLSLTCLGCPLALIRAPVLAPSFHHVSHKWFRMPVDLFLGGKKSMGKIVAAAGLVQPMGAYPIAPSQWPAPAFLPR
jgi:hypothetical protein